MRERLRDRACREEHGELLAAVTVGASAAAHHFQRDADLPQQLVAHVVAVLVVEALEVVDVHHGDRVLAAEPQQRLVEGAASRQPGQWVVIGHAMRGLDERDDQDEPGGRQVRGRVGWHARVEGEERRHHRPGEARLDDRLAKEEAADDETEGRDEGEDRRLRHERPRSALPDEAALEHRGDRRQLGPGHERDDERLDAERADEPPAPRAPRRALGHPRERRQVQRQEERHAREDHAAGAAGGSARAGDVDEQAIGDEEDEQRQDELPPVEAPPQQHPRAEDQPGRDRRQCRERVPERRRPERHHGAQEQDTARQDVREGPVQLTAAGI